MNMNIFDPAIHSKVWEPNSKPQRDLLTCPADEIFAGGGKLGGKSDGILGEFFCHAMKYESAARGLCLRRELKQLGDLVARSKELYAPIGATFNGSDDMWTFPNGATLLFGGLGVDSEHQKYQGFGRTRIYVEELGAFPTPYPIDMLIGNLRSSNPNIKCKFIATGNFIGPGHGWVKQRFVDPAPTGYTPIPFDFEYVDKNTNQTIRSTKYRMWIPSTVFDNPVTNKPQYIGNIKRMGSPKMVEALLYGNPNIIEGSFFPEFDSPRGRHVIEPFTIPAHWTKIHGTDWGGTAPWANLWAAVTPKDSWEPEPVRIGSSYNHRRYMGNLPPGALVVYRELYIAKRNEYGVHINEGLNWDTSKYAYAIREIEDREETKKLDGEINISYRVAGLDMWRRGMADQGPGVAEILRVNHNLLFRKAQVARTDRTARSGIGGWEHIRSLLVGRDQLPMLYVFSNCIDLIRCFPLAQYNPNQDDDKLKGEDHNLDALRYIVQSRPHSGIDDRMFAPQPMAWRSGNEMYAHAPGLDDL